MKVHFINNYSDSHLHKAVVVNTWPTKASSHENTHQARIIISKLYTSCKAPVAWIELSDIKAFKTSEQSSTILTSISYIIIEAAAV
jgi:hypothetical protein